MKNKPPTAVYISQKECEDVDSDVESIAPSFVENNVNNNEPE